MRSLSHDNTLYAPLVPQNTVQQNIDFVLGTVAALGSFVFFVVVLSWGWYKVFSVMAS